MKKKASKCWCLCNCGCESQKADFLCDDCKEGDHEIPPVGVNIDQLIFLVESYLSALKKRGNSPEQLVAGNTYQLLDKNGNPYPGDRDKQWTFDENGVCQAGGMWAERCLAYLASGMMRKVNK